ncbi:MAG: dTMP kinase [Sphingomonadales bacterium]|nr:MAG: dTMP kinase [Sphingomonadales bacterium]
MTLGKFIAFEGGEGVGKSTQAKLLISALAQLGINADLTREPGGTPGAEAIRELLLNPPGNGWDAEAEALLFAAARSDHVAKRIRPALETGKWVITDRFVDSSRAYQGAAGKLGEATINVLHEIGSCGLRPDLTILLEVDNSMVEDRLALRDGGNSDAIGGRAADYHRAVAEAFRGFARSDPSGFALIDAEGTPQEVHDRVMHAIRPLIGD